MQSSELSVSPKPTDTDRSNASPGAICACWFLRVVLGAVFLFSGFTKAVDPWGSLYKFQEYFASWALEPSRGFCLIAACLLALFEFGLGIVIITGSYRKVAPRVCLAFMALMTLLSLYISITDPVSDCGCFGEAVILSNTATLLKNIVLLVLSFLLMRTSAKVASVVAPALQWLVLVFTTFYVIAIQIYGYQIQPLVDFRAFPNGTDLYEKIESDAANDVGFVYEKDGQQLTFAADNLPDDTWTFVGRTSGAIVDNADFAVFDLDDDEVTEDIVNPEGYMYLLIVSDPDRYGPARAEMANRLYQSTEGTVNEMVAIVGASAERTRRWIELVEAEYPVYTADPVHLKTLARGDAALVCLRNGVIEWKTNIFALSPDFPATEVSSFITDGSETYRLLCWFTLPYAATIFLLCIATPLINRRRKRENTDED